MLITYSFLKLSAKSGHGFFLQRLPNLVNNFHKRMQNSWRIFHEGVSFVIKITTEAYANKLSTFKLAFTPNCCGYFCLMCGSAGDS